MPEQLQKIVPFNPLSIASLKGWWKSGVGVFRDAGVTPAGDGDTVQQWNDQSGNGNNLVQATLANRPTFKVSIVNGVPVVRFNGTAAFMTVNFGATFTQPNTMIFLWKNLGGQATGYVFDGIAGGNRNAFGRGILGGTTLDQYAGAAGVSVAWDASMAYQPACLLFQSGNSVNIQALIAQSNGNLGSNSLTGLTIGASNGGAQFFNFDLAEFMIFNGLLSGPQVDAALRSLIANYAL